MTHLVAVAVAVLFMVVGLFFAVEALGRIMVGVFGLDPSFWRDVAAVAWILWILLAIQGQSAN